MRVYPLDSQELTEEQMAVVFAMTSRSPDPFDKIAPRVSEAKAADFHERWVLDYGHASVAEHAVLHLAIEDISRLTCDELENNRLASYTEKSSRYQVINRDSYHVPTELDGHPELRDRYIKGMKTIFAAYHLLLTECVARLKEDNPRGEKERENAYGLRIRRIATDACRGVLPAATLTNAGMTANARTMEHAISKLMSHNLDETQQLGETLRAQGRSITPTLIKYAGRSDYLAKPAPTSTVEITGDEDGGEYPEVELHRYDVNAAERLAATLLYRNSNETYFHCMHRVGKGGPNEVSRILREALNGLGPHDAPPREFESVTYDLETRLDYGALREFRRHRMMTPIFQPLTTGLGVNIPSTIVKTELIQEFEEATAAAENLHDALRQERPEIAGYAVTHAHHQRVLLHVNLRELYHMLRLRTSERAHESIRGPMMGVLETVARVNRMLVEPILPNEGI